MKIPESSIIILNWNGKDMTAECLKSLRLLKYKNFEIIVVDNGSDDGSSTYLAKKFPKIKLIEHKENLGFAGGNNSALDFAKGKFLIFLNNDMAVDTLWLSRLVNVLKKDKKAAACGGGRFDWNNENPLYSKKNILRTIKHIHRFTGIPWEENQKEKYCEVDTISGGAFAIKREVVNKLGLFDDRFFAYVEDRDLFARVKRAGYKIKYVPKAYIWHQISKTGKRNKYKFFYLTIRNHFYFLFKNFDFGYLQFAILYFILREIKSNIKEIIVNQRDKDLEQARWDVLVWLFRNFKNLMVLRRKTLAKFPNSSYNNLIGKEKRI